MSRALPHRLAGNVLVLAAPLVLLLIPLVASAADATPKPKSRAHNAEFAMPEGWLRGNNEEGNFILVPPDQPQGERVEIHFGPFDQAARGVRWHAEDSVGNLKKDFNDVRIEQPYTPGRLPPDVDTMTVVASGAFRDAPGRRVIVRFTEIDGGGGSSQGLALVATTPQLFEKYRPAYEELVNSITLPSRTQLVAAREGVPALTMYTVHSVTDFLEWAMDVPFTESQRAAIRQHFVTSWEKNDREEIDGANEILKARLELDKLTDANKKELARQAIRTGALKQWREEAGRGDAMARLMVEIYDAAHQPLVAGDPPLTRQASDAALEILHFMASRVVGTATDVSPSAEQKEQFAKNLAAAYANMPKENREELAKMPTYWAALRVAWPEISKDEQSKLTTAWADSPQVKPIVERIREVQAQAASGPKSDTRTAAELMQKMYQEQRTFTALSNASYQMHLASMQIARNIGGGNYRYEYRYR